MSNNKALLFLGIGLFYLNHRNNKKQTLRSCSCPTKLSKKEQAWKKARKVCNYSPDDLRLDACNNIIKFEDYGNRNSEYGWELDHIVPRAAGGSDDSDNLQALNWQENVTKSDQYPYKCRNQRWVIR